MFDNNDSAENERGVEATDVGTGCGGGNGAVNKGDDPNGAPEFGVGGVGRLNEPGTILVDGDEDALDESGGQEGGPTKLCVFGYARLETGYVEAVDETIAWPGAVLYGVNNEDVLEKAAADGGITEEPGVVAVDFADKLLTL